MCFLRQADIEAFVLERQQPRFISMPTGKRIIERLPECVPSESRRYPALGHGRRSDVAGLLMPVGECADITQQCAVRFSSWGVLFSLERSPGRKIYF